jgi:hypothetical protein
MRRVGRNARELPGRSVTFRMIAGAEVVTEWTQGEQGGGCGQLRVFLQSRRARGAVQVLQSGLDSLTRRGIMSPKTEEKTGENPSVTLPATVEKIIKPFHPSQPETAQIKVDDAEPLYQELRIENKLTKENGEEVGLKEGAKIEVTIEADEKDIKPKGEKH